MGKSVSTDDNYFVLNVFKEEYLAKKAYVFLKIISEKEGKNVVGERKSQQDLEGSGQWARPRDVCLPWPGAETTLTENQAQCPVLTVEKLKKITGSRGERTMS